MPLNLQGLGQRAMQAWKGLQPTTQQRLIGAGAGALGGALTGGADEQGQTHYLRNMALGAGAGAYAAPHVREGYGKLRQWMGPGRTPGGGIPQAAAPQQPQLMAQSTVPKLSAAYEAGKQAALAKFQLG